MSRFHVLVHAARLAASGASLKLPLPTTACCPSSMCLLHNTYYDTKLISCSGRFSLLPSAVHYSLFRDFLGGAHVCMNDLYSSYRESAAAAARTSTYSTYFGAGSDWIRYICLLIGRRYHWLCSSGVSNNDDLFRSLHDVSQSITEAKASSCGFFLPARAPASVRPTIHAVVSQSQWTSLNVSLTRPSRLIVLADECFWVIHRLHTGQASVAEPD